LSKGRSAVQQWRGEHFHVQQFPIFFLQLSNVALRRLLRHVKVPIAEDCFVIFLRGQKGWLNSKLSLVQRAPGISASEAKRVGPEKFGRR
jgi:hypothetical protein